jgi:cysteine synthase
LAYFSKLFWFKVEIIAPSSTAQCKKRLIQSYWAKLIEVDGITDDCIDLRTKMHEENKWKYYLPDQFTNEANLYAHYNLTWPRIVETLWKDLDFFCAGLGTAGTVIWAWKYLKEINPNIKILAINTVEKIEWLRNFKTSKVVVPFYEENKDKIIDETIDVTQEDMKAWLNMYLTEWYSVWLSSWAILSWLSRWLKWKEGLKWVTIAPDGWDFYL